MMPPGVYRSDAPPGLPGQIDIDLKDANPIEAIARALEFPAWFGGNWDALEDCLGDLSWREAPHRLVLRNFQPGDELGILIDVLSSAAQFWEEQGGSFLAIFVDPQRLLPLPLFVSA
jgi:hypothetical protein